MRELFTIVLIHYERDDKLIVTVFLDMRVAFKSNAPTKLNNCNSVLKNMNYLERTVLRTC